ncbi:MAG: biopolymer transporter ExbD [Pseudomonadota bacterium]
MKVNFKTEGGLRRGKVGLTPMVDVVFLLLVFFMLAATYGEEANAIRLTPAGGEGEVAEETLAYEGEPRLVSITPEKVRLNGFVTELQALPEALTPLMARESDVVVLRAVDGATLQRVVEVMDLLRGAGIGTLVLAE